MFARALFVVASLVLSVGCRAATDVGRECTLGRADGGVIRERDISTIAGSNRDFIQFGNTECDDLVCVRDNNFQSPMGSTPESGAKGYCSKQCVPGTVCPSVNAADDEKASTRFNCRSLLLDPQTLASLCPNDGGACRLGTTDPNFCARGTGANSDGGT